MLECIYQKIETYRDPVAVLCAYPARTDLCDSLFLGLLLKTFTRHKIYSPNISELGNYQNSLSIQKVKNVLDGLQTSHNIILHEWDARVCSCGASSSWPGKRQCGSCGKPGANHASSCSPILKLKPQIEVMFTGIQGLEWSQFVCNSNRGATADPKYQNLWDYLECN